MDKKSLESVALSMRSLTIDAIQKANSGHPGLPLGAAELGAYLYGAGMKYDPADPSWIDRDRFVLSAGHGSMFLYSILHLAGFPVSIEDIQAFRQVGSKCPGHPEYGVTPGVETTTGPLGQGIAMAVGMAIAERMMGAKFNRPGAAIFDHYTYTLAGDGCLMEGVSGEACSLAGHLGLGKLIAYYDSNAISIDGSTSLAFTEDVAKRFEAYGWQVLEGSMYDYDGLASLTAKAKAEAGRPSLIVLKSVIGKGSPGKQGTAGAHGSPLGEEEAAKAKALLGIPADKPFWVAPEAYAFFERRRAELSAAKAEWQRNFEAWGKANPELSEELNRWYFNRPAAEPDLPSFKVGDKIATRNASGKVLAAVATAWPNLVGGSADLQGPNVVALPAAPSGASNVFGADNPGGRYIHFGVREFAMTAISNGIALHGGLRAFASTFLVFADYMRPAIRLAALMKLPVVYVLTHDSIFVGEDGPTVLALSRQNLPVFAKDDPEWPYTMALGAYVARNSGKSPEVVLVASGSEVSLAFAAAELVRARKPELAISVVSVPDRGAFYRAPAAVRDAILSPPAKVFVAEAGIAMGWERIAPADHIFSIERFGESGPGDKVAAHLGFTAQAFADLILGKL
jgi:transketolase